MKKTKKNKCLSTVTTDQSTQIESTWEEMLMISDTVRNSLVVTLTMIDEIHKTLESIGKGDDPELIVTVNTLKNDMDVYTKRFMEIRSKHENKKGVILPGDDFTLSLTVHQDYTEFNIDFETNTQLSKLLLSEKMSIAISEIDTKMKLKKQTEEVITNG